MAKLNVVIPAVNVTVGGVEYRKVERAARPGDIVKIADDYSYLTEGAFYEVTRVDSAGDPHILDNDEDDLDLCGKEFDVYEKVAQPAVEETSKVRNAKAVVGDRIKITDAFGTNGKYKNGDEFVVKRLREDGRVYVAEHGRPIAQWEYEIVTEESDVIVKKDDVVVHNGVRYRKVARKADVGELVIIVDAHSYGSSYQNGDILTVREPFDTSWVYLGDVSYATMPSEYAVLEPVESAQERLKVGDYGRITQTGITRGLFSSHKFSVGQIVKVTLPVPRNEDRIHAESIDGIDKWFVHNDDIVLATDEEVAAAKAALDPRNKFAVGDKVRLVSGGDAFPLNGFTNGEIYEVADPKTRMHGDKYVNIKRKGGGGFALPSQLVKLTVEDIAAEAIAAKWRAIGRKVNEFKRGDIVRFNTDTGARDYGKGSIAEIESEVYSSGSFSFGGMFGGHIEWCELVTPVEQRFDRAGDGDDRGASLS